MVHLSRLSLLAYLGLLISLPAGASSFPLPTGHLGYLRDWKAQYPQQKNQLGCKTCHVRGSSLNRYGEALRFVANSNSEKPAISAYMFDEKNRDRKEFKISPQGSIADMSAVIAIVDGIDLVGDGMTVGQRIHKGLHPAGPAVKQDPASLVSEPVAARVDNYRQEALCYRLIQESLSPGLNMDDLVAGGLAVQATRVIKGNLEPVTYIFKGDQISFLPGSVSKPDKDGEKLASSDEQALKALRAALVAALNNVPADFEYMRDNREAVLEDSCFANPRQCHGSPADVLKVLEKSPCRGSAKSNEGVREAWSSVKSKLEALKEALNWLFKDDAAPAALPNAAAPAGTEVRKGQ